MQVNRFTVNVNGVISGLTQTELIKQDSERPTSNIILDHSELDFVSEVVMSGTANDNVEVTRVNLSIKNLDLGQNWNGSSFQFGEVRVTASGTDDWTYLFEPGVPGNYRVAAFAIDSSGNIQNTYNGVKFTVGTTDTSTPESTIDVPSIETLSLIHI